MEYPNSKKADPQGNRLCLFLLRGVFNQTWGKFSCHFTHIFLLSDYIWYILAIEIKVHKEKYLFFKYKIVNPTIKMFSICCMIDKYMY